jgi:hypothetical protein
MTGRSSRDRQKFTVRQVHRADQLAELAADGTRLNVPFTDLRRKWELVRDRATPRGTALTSLHARDAADVSRST